MNFLRKWKLYSQYKKIIKENKSTFENDFRIKIDFANRLYTVVSIPPQEIGEAYSLRKSDVDAISERFVREYMKDLSDYLSKIGLNEMVDFYGKIQKVDKYSFLIVLGFKLFRTDFLNKMFWYRFVPIVLLLSIVAMIVLSTIN